MQRPGNGNFTCEFALGVLPRVLWSCFAIRIVVRSLRAAGVYLLEVRCANRTIQAWWRGVRAKKRVRRLRWREE